MNENYSTAVEIVQIYSLQYKIRCFNWLINDANGYIRDFNDKTIFKI